MDYTSKLLNFDSTLQIGTPLNKKCFDTLSLTFQGVIDDKLPSFGQWLLVFVSRTVKMHNSPIISNKQ